MGEYNCLQPWLYPEDYDVFQTVTQQFIRLVLSISSTSYS